MSVDDHHLAKYEDQRMRAIDVTSLIAAHVTQQIVGAIRLGSVGGRHHERRRRPNFKLNRIRQVGIFLESS